MSVAAVLVLALALGVLCGWLVFRRLAAREYERGLFAGELQAKLLYGWHAPVNANEASVRADQPRRRSPNEQAGQFVSRAPVQRLNRPVLHD